MLGLSLALIGAAMAVALAGFGSIVGVGIAGVAGDAVVAEEPEKFGKCLILQALPGTQGIYGFLGAFLVIMKLQLLSDKIPANVLNMSWQTGIMIIAACLPVALGGWLSGIYQGKVSAAGMAVVSKSEEDFGKSVIMSAMVETYAVLGLVSTILMLNAIKL